MVQWHNVCLELNADEAQPQSIARRTRAARVAFSMERASSGCYVESGRIVCGRGQHTDPIIELKDIPLLGAFNVQNVLASAAVAGRMGISPATTRDAVKE